jgi:hypothetical protein
LAAAGEYPPVVFGVVWVAGVDEEDFVVALRSRTRAPTRRAGSLATVIRWVLVLGHRQRTAQVLQRSQSSVQKQLVNPIDAADG